METGKTKWGSYNWVRGTNHSEAPMVLRGSSIVGGTTRSPFAAEQRNLNDTNILCRLTLFSSKKKYMGMKTGLDN